MSSNYWDVESPAEVRENQFEVKCARCHGSGLVMVHGQETDCIDCEGYGSVLV